MFDCGPSSLGRSSPESRAEATVGTAFGALLAHGITLDRQQRLAIRSAAARVEWPWQTDAIFEWQAKAEPPVPTLCICADDDDLMRFDDTQHFANVLRTSARQVFVTLLHGNHVRLLDTDADRFGESVTQLLLVAGLAPQGN